MLHNVAFLQRRFPHRARAIVRGLTALALGGLVLGVALLALG